MVNENDLEEILAQELERIKECGERINLAEIERRTGISRAVLRRWQRNGYSLADDKRGRPAATRRLERIARRLMPFSGKV